MATKTRSRTRRATPRPQAATPQTGESTMTPAQRQIFTPRRLARMRREHDAAERRWNTTAKLDVASLFAYLAAPEGLIEMNADIGVTAQASILGRDETEFTVVDVAVMRNSVGGYADCLTIDIKGIGLSDGDLTPEPGERYTVRLRAKPTALLALATVLPRVVELARRDGLFSKLADRAVTARAVGAESGG